VVLFTTVGDFWLAGFVVDVFADAQPENTSENAIDNDAMKLLFFKTIPPSLRMDSKLTYLIIVSNFPIVKILLIPFFVKKKGCPKNKGSDPTTSIYS
jgi:hypothetical protein